MLITLRQSNQLKAIAILMMVCLHLFNRDYVGLFQPLIFVKGGPLSYYISLFWDACVPILAFVSGFGLYYKFSQNSENYISGNLLRIKRLYLNYWIILVLFVSLGWMLDKEGYPGDLSKVILNVTGIEPSYNGAWWFFTIYILFVIKSNFWFRILDREQPYLLLVFLLITYSIAFYFRVYKVDVFSNVIAKWFHKELALYFGTLLQFMLGAYSLKYDWAEKVSLLFKTVRFKNIIISLLIFGLIILHALIPNFIVAPLMGLVFIRLFIQFDLPVFLGELLDFFAVHSTNILLTYMFFYAIYFKEFIYYFHYVPFIFVVLVLLCVLSSFVVNSIINFLK